MIHFFRKIIYDVIASSSRNGENTDDMKNVLVEPPKDSALGDLYTNAAMVFSKRCGLAPKALAGHIVTSLKNCELISKIEIVGAGFINFCLKIETWHSVIKDILFQKKNYSFTNIAKNEKINIEFVSANPTGPLHTGHARNAVLGSVISNLLTKIGYQVTKEFYINDQGNQIKSLARSLYLRYRECLGSKIDESDFTDDMYIGEYVKDLAEELVSIYGDEILNKDESEWIKTVGKFAVDRIIDNIKSDLKLIDVEMDVYTSEGEICSRNMVEEALSILQNRGDIYEGILPRPKGIEAEDGEERPQILCTSSNYGDDIDRAIKKFDESWTYFAGDIAYHLDKIQRGFHKMINILGADHAGYVKRIKSVVKSLSDNKAGVEIRLYQLVNFLENGLPTKMSKRSGNFITLRDVVNRVGKDITRFMMISRHHDVMIDFDFEKVAKCTMDNPIFYIQYAYARISSVFRNAMMIFPDITNEDLKNAELSHVNDEAELALMKTLSLWPEQIASAAISLEPHRIPHHLHNIASLFHSLWNKGKSNDILRFINEKDKSKTIARLALLEATRIVLEDGLRLIGVVPMTEMK